MTVIINYTEVKSEGNAFNMFFSFKLLTNLQDRQLSYRSQGPKSCKLCDYDDDEDNTLVVSALTVLLP